METEKKKKKERKKENKRREKERKEKKKLKTEIGNVNILVREKKRSFIHLVLHQLGNLSEWIPFQALFKQHGLDRLFQ